MDSRRRWKIALRSADLPLDEGVVWSAAELHCEFDAPDTVQDWVIKCRCGAAISERRKRDTPVFEEDPPENHLAYSHLCQCVSGGAFLRSLEDAKLHGDPALFDHVPWCRDVVQRDEDTTAWLYAEKTAVFHKGASAAAVRDQGI